MNVHEYAAPKKMYTNMYTIFCYFCGIVWNCTMSFCGVIGDNILKYSNFGSSWNHSISMALVPLSPQQTL